MKIVRLEIDSQLLWLLTEAAKRNHSTLEQECVRRLKQEGGRSRYMQALLAEMRADDQARHASSH